MPFPQVNPKLLTPTQTRLLSVLLDGEPHTRADLRSQGVNGDELDGFDTLNKHVSNLRRHLRPIGQDIVCVRIKGQLIGYQLVVKYRHGGS
jgi:DNA-binding response OmpR family regulator